MIKWKIPKSNILPSLISKSHSGGPTYNTSRVHGVLHRPFKQQPGTPCSIQTSEEAWPTRPVTNSFSTVATCDYVFKMVLDFNLQFVNNDIFGRNILIQKSPFASRSCPQHSFLHTLRQRDKRDTKLISLTLRQLYPFPQPSINQSTSLGLSEAVTVNSHSLSSLNIFVECHFHVLRQQNQQSVCSFELINKYMQLENFQFQNCPA